MWKKYLTYLSIGTMLKSIVPQTAPDDDPLFNRRRLAYFGLVFSIYWVHLILVVYVFGPVPDAVCITAFLSVPATLAGLGFYKYLRAAENDDAIKNGNNSVTPVSNSTVTVTVDNKQPNPQEQVTDTGTGQSSISTNNGTDLKTKSD